MKRLLIVSSLVFVVAASAESPKGFVDIPFGTPFAAAETMIAAREGLKVEDDTPARLTYTGGTFAGQPVTRWTFAFPAGRFASGSVLIDKVKKPVYDDIKAQLTRKYGKPDSEKGHHSWDCLWEFRSDGRRTVLLQYEHAGRVVVTYTHGVLANAAPAGKKSDL